MGAIIEVFGDRTEWLRARRNGIGGSDAPRILGVDGENGAADVWCEKIATDDPDKESGERAKWGLRFERPIIEGYGEDSGREIIFPANRYEIWRHPEKLFAAFTPDAMQTAEGFVGAGIVQAKNVGSDQREKWLEGAPEKYVVQLQHEMMVAGAEWGTLVAVFGGNECAWFDYPANREFHEALLDTEAEFWECVERRVCPEVDPALKSALKTLKRLYPISDQGIVRLEANRWTKALDDLVKLDEEKKECEAEIDKIKAAFQAEMKTNEVAILNDGRQVTWKTQNRKEYTVSASRSRVFRYPR